MFWQSDVSEGTVVAGGVFGRNWAATRTVAGAYEPVELNMWEGVRHDGVNCIWESTMTTVMGSLTGTADDTENDNRGVRGRMHSNRLRTGSYTGRSTALGKASSVTGVGVEGAVGGDDDDDAAGDGDDREMGWSLLSKLAHCSGAAGVPTVMRRALAAAWTLFHWQQSVQRVVATGSGRGTDDADDGAVTEAKAELTKVVGAAGHE